MAYECPAATPSRGECSGGGRTGGATRGRATGKLVFRSKIFQPWKCVVTLRILKTLHTKPKFIITFSAFPDWGGPGDFSSYFTSDPAAKESAAAAAAGYRSSYDSGYGSGSTSGYEQQPLAAVSGVREGKEEKGGGYGGYDYGAAVVQSKEAGEKGEKNLTYELGVTSV